MNGTMASYAEQILVSTGRSDWKSKIEDDEQGVFLRQLKKFLGQSGKFSDVRIQLRIYERCALLTFISHFTTS